MSERRRRTVPGILLSLVLVAVGVVLITTWWGRGDDQRRFPSQSFADGALVVRADRSEYLVFERVDGTADRPTIAASAITVTAADGRSVPVRAASTHRRQEGSSAMVAAARFTTPAAGTYEARVAGGDRTALSVERPGASVWTWLGRGALSILTVTVGVALLLVVLLRARSERRYARKLAAAAAMPATAPPATAAPVPAMSGSGAPGAAPGWYADPWRQAAWRYHDGQQWTSHTG